MTTALKIGIDATLGTGVIGGTAGITYALSQPKNLKEDLKRGEHKPLDTKADDSSWEKLVAKYTNTGEVSKIGKIADLNIEANTSPAKNPHPGIAQLRTKCEELFKKTRKDKDYEKHKTNAINWCTKKNITE
ncbi:hypothetical protein A6V39_00375 [Candidatus Mycoplasma haematobovis]|uniref:Uncharacterized protein n=1 Tax=Candidatus Mycoplasma haematobovis TaxID=432608 RepID=A0A1A9QEW7_9MOLU|nr:hypothetical protein [Candidatus Mycoplasma haematobovis]OAL10505.1 hypothetical protein A6V39_00375 [Candidatus Mycoplasma haematobovis]